MDYPTGFLAAGAISFAASLYIFYVVRHLPIGWPRLAASVPVFPVYIFIPWLFDPFTHCIGTAVLFCALTWVASFRLLTLCWNTGPAADPSVTGNLLRFHAALAIPIHIRPAGKDSKRDLKKEIGEPSANDKGSYPAKEVLHGTKWAAFSRLVEFLDSDSWPILISRCCLKTVAIGYLCTFLLDGERDKLPPAVIYMLYSVQLFLFVTIVEDGFGAVANLVSGVELEPHFDQPYLASSLEDFWAHRWNIMVSACLRETVYLPVLHLLTSNQPYSQSGGNRNDPTNSSKKGSFSNLEEEEAEGAASLRFGEAEGALGGTDSGNPAARGQTTRLRPGKRRPAEGTEDMVSHSPTKTLQPKPSGELSLNPGCSMPKPPVWARLTAMLATFFVSGVMHELAIFYLTFHVTGEMTAFFMLHGIATGLEVALKRRWRGRRKLPRIVSILLTVGFTFLTGKWLFFAPLVSYGVDICAIGNGCQHAKALRVFGARAAGNTMK